MALGESSEDDAVSEEDVVNLAGLESKCLTVREVYISFKTGKTCTHIGFKMFQAINIKRAPLIFCVQQTCWVCSYQ